MAEVQKGRAKRILALYGGLVLLVLGAFGYGRWQGIRIAHGYQAEAEAAHARGAAGLARASSEVAELRNRVQMLEARRHLALALMALEDRNFGTAREDLIAAGGELAAVRNPPAGADPAVLSRLAQTLQSARLVATEDLAQQRRRVLAWTRELDAQFPTGTPPPDAANADAGIQPQETGAPVATGANEGSTEASPATEAPASAPGAAPSPPQAAPR